MATSQGRQYTRQTTYRENRNEQKNYVYGSAVRQPERIPQRRPVEVPERRVIETPKPQVRNRRAAKKRPQFSIPCFLYLMCTIAFCGFVLVQYVSVGAEITANHDEITRLQSTLNDIRLENGEDYSRINNSIDLNEIKMKAIGKLGMTYATEGQIVYYNELDDDYVRQVSDIPTK